MGAVVNHSVELEHNMHRCMHQYAECYPGVDIQFLKNRIVVCNSRLNEGRRVDEFDPTAASVLPSIRTSIGILTTSHYRPVSNNACWLDDLTLLEDAGKTNEPMRIARLKLARSTDWPSDHHYYNTEVN